MNNKKMIFYYIIFSLVLGSLLVGIHLSAVDWVMQQGAREFKAPPFVEKTLTAFLENIPPEKRVALLTKMSERDGLDPMWHGMSLVDEQGTQLWTKASPFPLPPGPPDSGFEKKIRIEGEPAQYLLFRGPRMDRKIFIHGPGPGGPRGPEPKPGFGFRGGPHPRFMPHQRIGFVLLATLVIGILATIAFMLLKLRQKSNLAIEVMSQIKGGNFNARLPVDKLDELSKVGSSFNSMAEEITQLVKNLQHKDLVQKDLFQRLAHDLNTPVASFKSLVDTFTEKEKNLDEKTKAEILATIRSEVSYFQLLIEDILLLSQIEKLNQAEKLEPLSLGEVLEDEISSFRLRYPAIHFKNTVTIQEEFFVRGNHKLLRRLLRNALENAFYYTKSEVELSIEGSAKQIKVIISDNGPGLSPEQLKNFGHKSPTRSVQKTGQKISLGLGSVIMKNIAEASGGHIAISNRLENDRIQGAQLKITLLRA